MNALGIVVVIILSLWSITKTMEKLTDKVIERMEHQNVLLEEIKARLGERK